MFDKNSAKKYAILLSLAVLLFLAGCRSSSAPQQPSENLETDREEQEAYEPLPEVPKTDPVTFSFAGDTMAAGKVAPYLEQKGTDYHWQHAGVYLKQSDLAMVNLETPISLRGKAADKAYAYRTHPDFLNGMKRAGVDVVTLANNHSLDYGREALLDTFEHLHNYHIRYAGGGKNAGEAYAPVSLDVKNQRVKILAFSRVLPDVSWYAGADRPGLASGYQEERVCELVEKAAAQADITIVYMHWGEELQDHPLPEDRQLARQLIDRGADMVIGSHPHVLQGLEWYKGKLIAYSLGNFIFTTSYEPIARQSAVLQVKWHPDGSQTAKLIPMKIERGAVWNVSETEKEQILKRLNALSIKGTFTADGEFLSE